MCGALGGWEGFVDADEVSLVVDEVVVLVPELVAEAVAAAGCAGRSADVLLEKGAERVEDGLHFMQDAGQIALAAAFDEGFAEEVDGGGRGHDEGAVVAGGDGLEGGAGAEGLELVGEGLGCGVDGGEGCVGGDGDEGVGVALEAGEDGLASVEVGRWEEGLDLFAVEAFAVEVEDEGGDLLLVGDALDGVVGVG